MDGRDRATIALAERVGCSLETAACAWEAALAERKPSRAKGEVTDEDIAEAYDRLFGGGGPATVTDKDFAEAYDTLFA